MNYLAFGGYWFFGAADAAEMASTFASYGLITDAPTPEVGLGSKILDWFWEMF